MSVSDVSMENKTTEQSLAGKYLTFLLGDEGYGLSILKVKEIIGLMPITSVPRTPDYVKGVINLRGKVIPIIDLRLKFDMPSIDYTERTCIIVIEVAATNGTLQLGVVVDSVSEVVNINDGQVEPAHAFTTNVNTDYILGIAKIEDDVKILLDIDRIFVQEEIDALNKSDG